jgi:hypothetical protein
MASAASLGVPLACSACASFASVKAVTRSSMACCTPSRAASACGSVSHPEGRAAGRFQDRQFGRIVGLGKNPDRPVHQAPKLAAHGMQAHLLGGEWDAADRASNALRHRRAGRMYEARRRRAEPIIIVRHRSSCIRLRVDAKGPAESFGRMGLTL